jgi:hypothetical protein
MLKYFQDDDRRRIEVLASGELTFAEAKEFVDRQLLGGAWHYGVLYDVREVSKSVSAVEAAQLVEYIKTVAVGLPPRGPIAVVAAAPDIVALANSYAMLGQDARLLVQVFPDVRTAERWLDAQRPPK